jgi:hypothetical protein
LRAFVLRAANRVHNVHGGSAGRLRDTGESVPADAGPNCQFAWQNGSKDGEPGRYFCDKKPRISKCFPLWPKSIEYGKIFVI